MQGQIQPICATNVTPSGATTIGSAASLLLKLSEWGHHWSGVVPPLKEQMLKAIATLAVVAPLGMAHVNVYGYIIRSIFGETLVVGLWATGQGKCGCTVK
jgi:hypothetical protein